MKPFILTNSIWKTGEHNETWGEFQFGQHWLLFYVKIITHNLDIL